MDIAPYRYTKKGSFSIEKCDPSDSGGIKSKAEGRRLLEKNVERMARLQDRFYAQDREALLLIFQAMDSAGKDGAIKHVMSGLNPQGVQVYAFKQPSAEELDHDYLWRINRRLPERGNIGIFNRSYYEEVLVGRVHNLPVTQKLPPRCLTEDLWNRRYRQLRDYERYLTENGITVVKFFLHISGRAAPALSGPDRRRGEKLEVFRLGYRPSGDTGTSICAPMRTPSTPPPPGKRPGM